MTNLRDAAVYIHAYWAVTPDDDAATRARHSAAAVDFLKTCLTTVGQPNEAVVLGALVDTAAKRTLYPQNKLMHWATLGDGSSSATTSWIYSVHDVVGVLFAIQSPGVATANTLAELGQRFSTIGQKNGGSVPVLGGAICYVARTNSTAEADRAAVELFGVAPDAPPSRIIYSEVEQPVSIFHYLSTADFAKSDASWETLAVFLPITESADQAITLLLNEVLPDILRALFKIRDLYRRQSEPLREGLNKLELELNAKDWPTTSLVLTERELELLSVSFKKFSSVLGYLHRIQLSIEINCMNLSMALGRIEQSGAGWIRDAELAATAVLRQIRTDIAYYEVRTRESEVALSTLRTRAELQRIKMEEAEAISAERANLYITAVGIALAALAAFDGPTVKAILNAIHLTSIQDDAAGTVFVFFARCWIVLLILIATMSLRNYIVQSKKIGDA